MLYLRFSFFILLYWTGFTWKQDGLSSPPGIFSGMDGWIAFAPCKRKGDALGLLR